MATVEGLNLRGGRFYLRVLIPQDLQGAYGGKTRVNLSLRTCDRATAVLNGLRTKVQWLEEFSALRRGQPLTLTGSPIAETLLAQGNGIYLPVRKATDSSREGFNDTPMPGSQERYGTPYGHSRLSRQPAPTGATKPRWWLSTSA